MKLKFGGGKAVGSTVMQRKDKTTNLTYRPSSSASAEYSLASNVT
jgi:hypothetical protein